MEKEMEKSELKNTAVNIYLIDHKGEKHDAGMHSIMISHNERYGELSIKDLVIQIPSLRANSYETVIFNQDEYMDLLMKQAKEVMGIEYTSINNSLRKHEGVFYRQMLMFFIYHTVSISTSAIGKKFGKDHATVLHGKRRFIDLVSTGQKDYMVAKRLCDEMEALGYVQPQNALKAALAKEGKEWK